jgi:hypothetical protein
VGEGSRQWRRRQADYAGAPAARPGPADRLREVVERGEAAAEAWSARPGAAFARLLAAAAVVAALGIPLGLALNGDQAAVFRELMPGTWLSFGELLAAAAAASATHRATTPGTRWHETFWGLSGGIFVALAFIEIAQPTVFIAHWLRDNASVSAPFGFADLDAAILVGVFAVIAVSLLVRVRALLAHPRAVVLLAIGGVLAVCSQTLDAAFPATRWEFVAEESFKLVALPFMVAGFLVALREVRVRPPQSG